jgi:hypothetical protein
MIDEEYLAKTGWNKCQSGYRKVIPSEVWEEYMTRVVAYHNTGQPYQMMDNGYDSLCLVITRALVKYNKEGVSITKGPVVVICTLAGDSYVRNFDKKLPLNEALDEIMAEIGG